MPAHFVHVEPEYRTNVVKTYEPELGDSDVHVDIEVIPEVRTVAWNPQTKRDEIVVVSEELQLAHWEFSERVQTNAPTDCPDCARGLWSKDDLEDFGPFYVCFNVTDDDNADPCHTGCIVACGFPRGYSREREREALHGAAAVSES